MPKYGTFSLGVIAKVRMGETPIVNVLLSGG